MSQQIRGLHTRQEILSQPQVWKASLERLRRQDVSRFPDMADFDQVIYCGCGSTYYLARWASRASEAFRRIVSRAAPASELLLFPEAWWHAGKKTLLVAISRSGETTETIRAMERFVAAKQGQAVVVSCYGDSPLVKCTADTVVLPEAQEQSVAQTRSFTSMLLGVTWLIMRGMPDGLERKMADAGQRLIERHLGLAEQIGRDDLLQRFFFLGSGPQYGLANEAMLKMKEMSLSYAESFHFHEFRHGPMSVVDEESLILGLVDESAGTQQSALFGEMKRLGARTLALQEAAGMLDGEDVDHPVDFGSGMPEIWRAPLYLPILQLIAYERAMHKGLDPDRPENLESVVVLNADLA